jgi:glycosyltransferase involved in cell wall biosynthesis
MSRPRVSIVTPSFNQAAFLEETLRSVLEQDYEPLEYLVVDDGSADESPEIIRRYEDRLAWWVRQANAGQVAALNRGFGQSTGEYMGFLNSDDTLLPGAISRLAAELERDPELWLVYGDAVYTDRASRQTGPLASREFDVVEMVRRSDNHIVQPATLWRREAWVELGPLNEDAYYFFDFEFFLRFPRERVRRIAEPVATYRIHPEAKSTGAQARRLALDHARLADDFFASDLLPAAARSVAREGRANAYLQGSEFAYEGLDLSLARRLVLTGLRLHPRSASPRWLTLAAKTYVPLPLVRRFREYRRR